MGPILAAFASALVSKAVGGGGAPPPQSFGPPSFPRTPMQSWFPSTIPLSTQEHRPLSDEPGVRLRGVTDPNKIPFETQNEMDTGSDKGASKFSAKDEITKAFLSAFAQRLVGGGQQPTQQYQLPTFR